MPREPAYVAQIDRIPTNPTRHDAAAIGRAAANLNNQGSAYLQRECSTWPTDCELPTVSAYSGNRVGAILWWPNRVDSSMGSLRVAVATASSYGSPMATQASTMAAEAMVVSLVEVQN